MISLRRKIDESEQLALSFEALAKTFGRVLGEDLQSSAQGSNDPVQRRAKALLRQFTKEANQQ